MDDSSLMDLAPFAIPNVSGHGNYDDHDNRHTKPVQMSA